MITHPTADELLAGVAGFIESIAPDLKDRDVFLARVSVNALNLLRRELDLGQEAGENAAARMRALMGRTGDFSSLNAALAEAIQAGAFDQREAELLTHLKASAIDRLRIDQPSYCGLKPNFQTP